MKKLVLVFAMILGTMTFAQSTNLSNADVATQEGTYTIGVNTSGLGFTNVGDFTTVNVGATFGGFIQNRLALMLELGYTSNHYNDFNSNDWVYGAGLKYYAGGVVPIGVGWTGTSGNSESLSYVKTQLGYAWFPFTNFSVEPTLRYDISTKDEHQDVFSGGVGFNLFF